MNDVLDSFIEGGCYLFKDYYDLVFVCVSCSNHIGKLVQYKKQTSTMWEKTGVSYFLNLYFDDDIKELFLNRENYEIIGKLGSNFDLSEDALYLLRRK